MSSTQHIKSLDGVRGIAVLAVVFCHMTMIVKDIPRLAFIADGWAGVEIFFVLSGFLITSILVRAREGDGYYRNFYFRRALRIWPLYYLYGLAMYGAFLIIPHLAVYKAFAAHSPYLLEHPMKVTTPLIICLLFLQNFWWPSLFGARDQVSITWSLCIEEQFYLVWPFFVKNFTQRTLRILLTAVIVVEPLLRVAASYLHYSHEAIFEMVYRTPFFHIDSIASGCLLALVWKDIEHKPQTRPAMIRLFFVALVPCWFLINKQNPWTFTVVTALSVSIVGMALTGVAHRLFTWRPLTFLGFISYGLYLIHPTVFDVLQSRTIYRKLGIPLSLTETELLASAVGLAVSIALAALSRYTLEAFFLRIKDRRSTGARGALKTLEVRQGA